MGDFINRTLCFGKPRVCHREVCIPHAAGCAEEDAQPLIARTSAGPMRVVVDILMSLRRGRRAVSAETARGQRHGYPI